MLTTPSGVILRMAWLNPSATSRSPLVSKTRPKGWLNAAMATLPSVFPGPAPARVPENQLGSILHLPSRQALAVHLSPSSHLMAMGRWAQAPSTTPQLSAVQTLPSSQLLAGPAMHAPALHASLVVHGLPSSQAPVTAAWLHPLALSQASLVQALPSSHCVDGGVSLRIRLLPVSTTRIEPSGSRASPLGARNLAANPLPSTQPVVEPTRVVTPALGPANVTRRTVCAARSLTTRRPCPSTTTSHGRMKRAFASGPSTCANSPPTSVVTVPSALIRRRRELPYSTTITRLWASIARPAGRLKLAALPLPSDLPALAPPANVLTLPLGVTLRTR